MRKGERRSVDMHSRALVAKVVGTIGSTSRVSQLTLANPLALMYHGGGRDSGACDHAVSRKSLSVKPSTSVLYRNLNTTLFRSTIDITRPTNGRAVLKA